MIDIQRIICQVLIDAGIASGNVQVADETQEIETLPAVFVTLTSYAGVTAEGFFTATVVVNCIDRHEYAAGVLADAVLQALDGFGGSGIDDIGHIGTYPRRTQETAPVTHTYAMTFRVLYHQLKKK